MARPVIFALAGVNGAGKSSVGGSIIAQSGHGWFNPDAFARELKAGSGCDQQTANGLAWAEGIRLLEDAIASRRTHVFETTLGGKGWPQRLARATRSHDVYMWFCGLASPELHLKRVCARAAAGGHDIPEAKIRERFVTAPANLVALMPHLTKLRVFDNSAEADAAGTIPDPMPVLTLERGRLLLPRPNDAVALAATPDWAKPLVAAAIELSVRKRWPASSRLIS